MDDELFLDPMTLSLDRDPPFSRGHGTKGSVQPRQISPVYAQKLEKDPVEQLETCMAATSNLISSLKGMESTSSRSLIASTSTRTITPATYVQCPEDEDILDQLETHLSVMQMREKRMDERIRKLEGIAERWELVDWAGMSEVDWRGLIQEMKPAVEGSYDGLPSIASTGLPSLHNDPLLSPSISDPEDPFSPVPRIQLPIDSQLSAHLSQLSSDPFLPSLLNLRETLHTHSSHHLATQRQIRHIKGALVGAKGRGEAEEAARRGIEVWEAGRMAERLRGESVRDKLEVERRSLDRALEVYEREMELKMRAVRTLSAR